MPISAFQYQEMLARTQSQRRRPVVGGEWSGVEDYDKEGDLHNDIIKYCKERGWLYFHGSMAHKTFRTRGEPDFHVWADGGRKFAFECKSRGGKLSTAQLGVIALAKQLGHTVHAIGSIEEFRELVKP